MCGFKIETTTKLNNIPDRLEAAIIQRTAQKLYSQIKEIVPEIEMEKSAVIFHSNGKNLVLYLANLSSQLQHKLQDSGLNGYSNS